MPPDRYGCDMCDTQRKRHRGDACEHPMELAMSCLTGRDEEVASVVEAKVKVEAREEDKQQAMETDHQIEKPKEMPINHQQEGKP